METKVWRLAFAVLLLVTAVMGINVIYSTCIALTDSSGNATSASVEVKFFGQKNELTEWMPLDRSGDAQSVNNNQTDCYNNTAPSIGPQITYVFVRPYNTTETVCFNSFFVTYGNNTVCLYDLANSNWPGRCLNSNEFSGFKGAD